MTWAEKLINAYMATRDRLIKEIKHRQFWGRNADQERALLDAIDREIGKLNKTVKEWAQVAVQESFIGGAMDAYRAISPTATMPAYSAFTGLHARAVEMLVHNTQGYLLITNNLIARQAADTVREIGVFMTTRKFGENLTWNQMDKEMQKVLLDEKFFTVPWRNGQGSMRVDSYAELVARTTTAEATNTGAINQMQEMDQHLVKMTAHNTTCKVCAPRQGRVYRLTDFPPGDERNQFPHIREGMPRWPTYKTVHPNCAHRLLPYVWSQKTDQEKQAALRDAGKPFDKDPRGEVEIARYNAAQKKLAERLRDRKQYERYKAKLGDDAPKTFSAFRAMKKSGNENWQALEEKYRNWLYKQDYNDIIDMRGKLSDQAARRWYKAHDEAIAGLVDQSKPLEAQARQAHALRNKYRTQARVLMADREKAAGFDITDPNMSFAEIMEHKRLKYGYTGDDAYRDIIRSAGTTRKSADKEAGLE